jgi:hypothetical protein
LIKLIININIFSYKKMKKEGKTKNKNTKKLTSLDKRKNKKQRS